jgi:citrate lyase subunit beta/citryl-CoA lyase
MTTLTPTAERGTVARTSWLPGIAATVIATACTVYGAKDWAGIIVVVPGLVIVAAFAPEADELQRAREVLDSVEEAQSRGDGTSVLADGSFLDVAMVEQARRTIELHERTHQVSSS